MKVTVEHYGVEGTGRTVALAKQDAGRQIKQALAGSYTPEILAWRGHALLVYREPLAGWGLRLIMDPERGLIEGAVYGTCYGSRDETIRAALSHLADLGWRAEDGDVPPPFLKDRQAIGDYRSKVKFWQRCARAKAAGLTDSNQIHAYGCEFLCDPAVLAKVDGSPSP